MNVVCIYRPPEDNEGRPYPNHNQTLFRVQKVKPKQVGEKGDADLYFDKFSNRFYELDSLGMKQYAKAATKASTEATEKKDQQIIKTPGYAF